MEPMESPAGETSTATGEARATVAFGGVQPAQGQMLLLEAARSLIHDTRNRLTGLSLYLDAWRRNFEGAPRTSKTDAAILERGLRSIEVLCGEFTIVEMAMASNEPPSVAGEVSLWYGCYLERLGIMASAAPCEDPVALTRFRWGIFSRALIELARVLVMVHARTVNVATGCREGMFRFEVTFSVPVGSRELAGHPLMNSLGNLLGSCGGEMEVSSKGFDRVVSVRFAQMHTALGR